MNDLCIYMTTHKAVPAPTDARFIPLQCGASEHDDLGILRDDSGESISHKNAYYSEMTGHYWIWKNRPSKKVGLVHYRRFFAALSRSFEYRGKQVASSDEIEKHLESYNLVFVQPLVFFHPGTSLPCSVESQYIGSVDGLDLIQARRAVAEVNSSYLDAYDFVMRNHVMIPFNMFATDWTIFDAYSAWLFDVLFTIEELIPLKTLDGYRARVPAFLAERLFTVWIGHNRKDLRLLQLPYIFFEEA